MLNPGFVCLDYQMPCSSNSHNSDMDSNPRSHLSHNSESPYMQSPQPPSRNVTPAGPQANFYQRPEMASHLQGWIQNHPERMQYNQGHSSNAPSVMSNMTRYSGMSTISVNTHATIPANSPYASNQYLNHAHGPLSSGSHSENIDPSQDIITTTREIIPYLEENDVDIVMKAAYNMKAIPKKLITRKPDEVENIVQCGISTLAEVLNRNINHNSNKETECHIYLCDALSEWVRTFPESANINLIHNKDNPNGLLNTLLKYSNYSNNPFDRKRLRHLFPSIYFLLLGKSSKTFAKAARETRLFEFLCQHLIETVNQSPDLFIHLKVMHGYIDTIRILMRKNVNYKKYVVNKKVYICVFRLLDFCLTHRIDDNKIRHIYEVTTGFFKALVAVNMVELVDELVKAGIMQRLLLFRVRFGNLLSDISISDTYECLANVGDSKELLNVPIMLPTNNNQACITIPFIISSEFNYAIEKNYTELLRKLIQFVCNGNRMPGYCAKAIESRQHQQIIHCLNCALKEWVQSGIDLSDDVDSCLLILQKFLNVQPQFFEIICHDYFINPLLFIRIIERNNPACTKRVLRLWSKFSRDRPLVFCKYAGFQISIPSFLINLISQAGRIYNYEEAINIIKLAIDVYKNLAKFISLKYEIIDSAKNNGLINLLSSSEDVIIIELMIDVFTLLCELHAELYAHFKSSLKDLLETYKNSSNFSISQKARTLLLLIDRDSDEYGNPLANSFFD